MFGKLISHKEIIKWDSHLTSNTKINYGYTRYFKLLDENIIQRFSTDSTPTQGTFVWECFRVVIMIGIVLKALGTQGPGMLKCLAMWDPVPHKECVLPQMPVTSCSQRSTKIGVFLWYWVRGEIL